MKKTKYLGLFLILLFAKAEVLVKARGKDAGGAKKRLGEKANEKYYNALDQVRNLRGAVVNKLKGQEDPADRFFFRNRRIIKYTWWHGRYVRMPDILNPSLRNMLNTFARVNRRPRGQNFARDADVPLVPLYNRFAPRRLNPNQMQCSLSVRFWPMRHYLRIGVIIVYAEISSSCQSTIMRKYFWVNTWDQATNFIIRINSRDFGFSWFKPSRARDRALLFQEYNGIKMINQRRAKLFQLPIRVRQQLRRGELFARRQNRRRNTRRRPRRNRRGRRGRRRQRRQRAAQRNLQQASSESAPETVSAEQTAQGPQNITERILSEKKPAHYRKLGKAKALHKDEKHERQKSKRTLKTKSHKHYHAKESKSKFTKAVRSKMGRRRLGSRHRIPQSSLRHRRSQRERRLNRWGNPLGNLFGNNQNNNRNHHRRRRQRRPTFRRHPHKNHPSNLNWDEENAPDPFERDGFTRRENEDDRRYSQPRWHHWVPKFNLANHLVKRRNSFIRRSFKTLETRHPPLVVKIPTMPDPYDFFPQIPTLDASISSFPLYSDREPPLFWSIEVINRIWAGSNPQICELKFWQRLRNSKITCEL